MITCMTSDMREFWNQHAATFDEEPDHGLRDPAVRNAWASLVAEHLPTPPANVTDIGCGTGSLSLLLAEAGYSVHGIDLSPRMIDRAREKAAAAGVAATFEQGDASAPDLDPSASDVVLARHILWAIPDPRTALSKWVGLLRPQGLLVLIEGRWSTGGGLTAGGCRSLVLEHRHEAAVHELREPSLWGRTIDDERYVVVSRQ